MAKKVYELAKELDLKSKELMDKLNQIGVSVSSHMSTLTDEDINNLKKSIKDGRDVETTIVTVKPKGPKKNVEDSPRVVVQAAAVAPKAQHQEKEAAPRKSDKSARDDRTDDAIHDNENKNAAENDELKAKDELPKRRVFRVNIDAEQGKETIEIPKAAEVKKEKEDENANLKQKDGKKEASEETSAEDVSKKNSEIKPAPVAKARKEIKAEENKAIDTKEENKAKKEAEPMKKKESSAAGEKQSRAARYDKTAEKAPEARFQRKRAERSEAPAAGQKDQKAKKGREKEKDKDKNKFAKWDQGKRGKGAVEERSLEKHVKPKKQHKPKVVEKEPEINMDELPAGTKIVNVPITVAGLCEQLDLTHSSVIMCLMKMGIMANINQNIDEDTLLILADELGVSVAIGKVEDEALEEGIEQFEDNEEDLKSCPPVITVMGHVDHGKTSLLDAIRNTNVTAKESGGITQHIGASEVQINGKKIVFLDTPGHEAFTAMRARGAHITDIAVLVVAADDSVKPQTIESISHAKAAGVPVIVAINKIDKPAANIDRVKQDLTEHGILVEDWGGDTICVPVSAKSGEGITDLLEMILLQAEVLELRANPNRLASGTVVEARLDKAKGPVATLLVMNGSIKTGDSIVAGVCAGRVRLMTNFRGDTIKKAGPATAVEILGLEDVPQAGDEFNVVKEDRIARQIADQRKSRQREEIMKRNSSTSLEDLFNSIQAGEVKDLNLIIKGDVQGSVGALVASLEKLTDQNVRVNIIHTGVGTVTESDVMLAGTTGAVIIGFNVRPSSAVQAKAEHDGIEIRTYRVIYDVIDDVESALKGMLDPEFKEIVLGDLEIRDTFKVPNVGTVGGAYVTNGKIVRNSDVRLIRDGIVIHEGKISSLKRYKDDVKEVLQGFECGIGIEDYNDIKVGDVIECFTMKEVDKE